MKKLIALVTSIALILSLTACSQSAPKAVTEEDANKYLTEFFSSYNTMNEYLKNPNVAISAFALDGAGLSALLRAVYQAESVTYAFPLPQKAGENVFVTTVSVTAPDIQPLYAMYAIDRQLAGDELPEDFVAQSFYNNILSGTTSIVTTEAAVTVRYTDGKWSVDPSNDLAFGIFPNIDKAN